MPSRSSSLQNRPSASAKRSARKGRTKGKGNTSIALTITADAIILPTEQKEASDKRVTENETTKIAIAGTATEKRPRIGMAGVIGTIGRAKTTSKTTGIDTSVRAVPGMMKMTMLPVEETVTDIAIEMKRTRIQHS